MYGNAVRQLPVLDGCLRQEDFARAVEQSVAKRFGDAPPEPNTLTSYVDSLHAAELGLAVACAGGHDAAWEHFITTYRPVLYRAARALTGDETAARELADALWAELYGVGGTRVSLEAGRRRRSLLEYFHGRSKLATWLRSVLSQRHVDRIRSERRTEPLETDDEGAAAPPATSTSSRAAEPPDPDRERYVEVFQAALRGALAELDARDRLRLSCYYVQELTLAETGQILGEHEATVSRRLAKIRRGIRGSVERQLVGVFHWSQAEVELCYRYVTEESDVDLTRLLRPENADATARQGSGA